MVEGPVEAVVLLVDAVAHGPVGQLGLDQDGRQVEPGGLPVVDGPGGVDQVDPADGLLQRAEAEGGQVLADLLGDVLEEGLDELGLPRVPGPECRVLGGDPHRAGVEVADPHHDAARDHQRGGGEPELLGPEQGADDHVPARLHLAVDLDDDAVAQIVGQQGLLGLGQAELPGDPGVLQGGERGGPGAPVVAGDEHHVGVGLGHAGGHRSHPDLGHQLHVDPGPRDWPT